MKKLCGILLCLCLLTACSWSSGEENASLKTLQSNLVSLEKLMSVIYLGEVDGDFSAVNRYLAEQSYSTLYTFLPEIKDTHFVQADGSELYCVVPSDQSVKLAIHKAKANESDGQLSKGEELLSKKDGKPILLRGNISELTPNLMIVAKKDDAALQYAPQRSGINRTLENSELLIYDGTPYEWMPEFNGMDSEINWDFYGNWNAKLTESDGSLIDMNLSILPEGEVLYSYTSERVRGTMHGHWFLLPEGKIRLSLDGMTVLDGVERSDEMDALFLWEIQDGNLVLKYFNGDLFYRTATIREFPFIPVE